MSLSHDEFFEWMDQKSGRVPLDEMTDGLRILDIDMDTVREFVRFSDTRYQRNLWHAGKGFHALILCWKNGQRSPIHDHRGSSCGVRVLQGVMTETVFEHGPNGMIVPVRTRELSEGGIAGSEDADIHQVSNLQRDNADLVTLHVYAPPLHVMGTYSLTDPVRREFTDPIFAFAAGAGI